MIAELELPVIAELELPVIAELELPVIAELELPVIAELELPVIAELELPVIAFADTPDVMRLIAAERTGGAADAGLVRATAVTDETTTTPTFLMIRDFIICFP